MKTYEVRSDPQSGDWALFDSTNSTRKWIRQQHPVWISRFKAVDFEHAKQVFEALTSGTY